MTAPCGHILNASTHSTCFSNVFSSQEYGVPFMETSAKTGANVELAFLAVAK